MGARPGCLTAPYGSVMRWNPGVVFGVVLVGAMSASCFGGSSHSSATSAAVQPLVVACDQVIIQAKSAPAGYRRVLGVIWVPPVYIPQVVSSPGGRWPYREKAGMVVRAGRSPVTVTVPQAWRTRAAITWGNDIPAVSSLRFSPCPSPPNVWNHYPGDFLLHSHGACLPLVFQVGQRKRRVWFGIDRRCR
jgi:hypothetical protein